MENNIITNGTEAFTPIIDKLGNIASEFLPYMLYIAIACLWIYLMYGAVKMIIRYIQDNILYKTRWKREKARRNMKRRREYKKRKYNDKNEELPF